MKELKGEVLSPDEMSDEELLNLQDKETKKQLQLIMDAFVRVKTPPSFKDIVELYNGTENP